MNISNPSIIRRPLGVFTTEESVRDLMEMYAQPDAIPYIPWHDWGNQPDDATREEFVEEVLRGEAALSIEDPLKFVRDIGGTITMRVTCKVPSLQVAPIFLQEYRQQQEGPPKKRKHRHSSISEKLVKAELERLGLDHLNDSWVAWWNDICARYDEGTLDPETYDAIIEVIIRLIREELRLVVTREDIGPDKIRFVPIPHWALHDPILKALDPDGTHLAPSYRGLWTRNRLLCFYWDMPITSSAGHLLFKEEGYIDSNEKNTTRWLYGHKND